MFKFTLKLWYFQGATRWTFKYFYLQWSKTMFCNARLMHLGLDFWNAYYRHAERSGNCNRLPINVFTYAFAVWHASGKVSGNFRVIKNADLTITEQTSCTQLKVLRSSLHKLFQYLTLPFRKSKSNYLITDTFWIWLFSM